jgi:hypothetical protein
MMRNALRAEFLKTRTTRTTAALIGLAVVLTALIATIEAATAGSGAAWPSRRWLLLRASVMR